MNTITMLCKVFKLYNEISLFKNINKEKKNIYSYSELK